jgi:choline kinase
MIMQRSLGSSRGISAIILAAGVGRRLGRAAPKVTLEFGGRTLLERHLVALSAHGVTDIAITVGHRADLIRDELARIGFVNQVTLINNPWYVEGSIVSLWAQRARLAAGAPVLLMDGDVLCDERMIARLLGARKTNVLLFDQAIEPDDEPVKICLRDNVIVDFAKMPTRGFDRHGESVGFFRFSARMAAALAARVAAYVEAGERALEYEVAIRDLILAHPGRFGYEDVSDLPWTEIDFELDVVHARQQVAPRLREAAHV